MEGMLWSTSPPEDPAPAIPAIQPAACSPSAGPAQANSEAGSESSRELYHCPTTVKTTSLRMSKSGLYGKHSIDHPLQMSIAKYLQVENVGRFMYYMDPKRPSLLFVRQHEKTREYSNKLSEAGLCKQTVQFYVKSVKKASASKQVSKEMARKWVLLCWTLKKRDFLVVMGKLKGPGCFFGHQLTQAELQLVLYYLEAVVILWLPSEDKVRSRIEKQGWTANIPDAALVLRQWKPSGGA
ncbi:hypothetical protein AOLI_G00046400 [Acnodon oligacanthus]